MGEQIEAFVGLDVAKAKHAVAIAEEGRTGEVRYFGEIGAEPPSVRRMVAKLEKPGKRLHFRHACRRRRRADARIRTATAREAHILRTTSA